MSSNGEDSLLRNAFSSLETHVRAGETHAVEHVLEELPQLSQDENSVVELIYNEFLIRDELGHKHQVDDYYARFPQHEKRLANLLLIHSALESGEFVSGDDAKTIRSVTVRRLDEGDRVGPFELFELLGSGGMGLVYRARQTGLDRIVALKVLRRAIDEPQELRRFIAEAKTAAQLQHPHIVQVFETDIFDSYPYIALEYMAGGSLEEELRQGPMSGRSAAQLMIDLAGAIEYAHEHGIVHRDLKPSNVLLTETGIAKVADFGLAKREYESEDASPGSITQTGTLLGTPSYMAPEQVRGDRGAIGPTTDVYGLGAVLYQAVTGQPPFTGQTSIDILQNIQNVDPVPPSRLNPQLPRDIETICLKCLEKESHRRYASATDFATDLQCFLDGRSISAKPSNVFRRSIKLARRFPVVASLLAMLAAALIVGFVSTTWLWQSSEQGRVTESQLRGEAVSSLYAQEIAFAQREVLTGNMTSAAGILDKTSKGERGWEFDYLNELCVAAAPVYDTKEGIVTRIKYSPDGRRVAYCTGRFLGKEPTRLTILDSATWKQVCSVQSEEATIYDFDFCGDGTKIATVEGRENAANTLKIWNAGTAELLESMSGERVKYAFSVAYHPDGKRVLIGGYHGNVELWNLETPGVPLLKHRFALHTQSVFDISFHPDGNRFASASRDGTIRLWDVASGEQLRLLYAGPDMRGVEFSPDGRRLAHFGYEGAFQLWDLMYDPPRRERVFLSEENGEDVRFTHDGRYLLGVGPELMIYDVHRERMKSRVLPTTSGLRAVGIHPSSHQVVTGDLNGKIQHARLAEKPTEHSPYVRDTGAYFADAAVDPTGQFIAVAPQANTVRPGIVDFHPRVYDRFRTLSKPKSLVGPKDWSSEVEYSRDGEWIAVACDDEHIYEFDSGSMFLKRKIEISGGTAGIAYHPSGALLSLAKSGELSVFGCDREAANNDPVSRFSVATSPHLFELSDSGNVIGIAEEDGRVVCLQVTEHDSGRLKVTQGVNDRVGDSPVLALAFSKSDAKMAASTQDGISLFELNHKAAVASKKIWTVATDDGAVTALAFHPDENRMASVSPDAKRVRVHQVAQGTTLIEFEISEFVAGKEKQSNVQFLPANEGKSMTLFVQGIKRLEFWPPRSIDGNDGYGLPNPVVWRNSVEWHNSQSMESLLSGYRFGLAFHSKKAIELLETRPENVDDHWHTHQQLIARCALVQSLRVEGKDEDAKSLLEMATREYHICPSRDSSTSAQLKGALRSVLIRGVRKGEKRLKLGETGDYEVTLAAVKIATLLPATRIVEPERLAVWGEMALERDPRNWRNWLLLGAADFDSEELTKAVASFTKAGECQSPDVDKWNAPVCFWLAIAHARQGSSKLASEWLERGEMQSQNVTELMQPLWEIKLQEAARSLVRAR